LIDIKSLENIYNKTVKDNKKEKILTPSPLTQQKEDARKK